MRFRIHKAVFLERLTMTGLVQRLSTFTEHTVTTTVVELLELVHALTPSSITISKVDTSL